jgi:DNA-binding winged helix-turn-helix (wHTH) protein
MAKSFAFERFVLDTGDRRLKADGQPLDLNARYFDALALLVSEHGKLVSKDRFLEEVWRGVPVTDEALTQCIKTLRRQLADDATHPRFIETVPKHGYRFIAEVEMTDGTHVARVVAAPQADRWQRFLALGKAGTIGGGIAGVVGGLIFGFAGASLAPAMGAISILLVLLCVTLLIALLGGAAVSFAIATAELVETPPWYWPVVAGAGGGLVVGATTKLLGLDAFALLVGRVPADITGALEGLLLGGSVGAGVVLTGRVKSRRLAGAVGAVAGALAGVTAALLGGSLLLGSLANLTRGFPQSRLHVDKIGSLFGEHGFGPVTQIVSAGLEGALFGGCVVAAMAFARRQISRR